MKIKAFSDNHGYLPSIEEIGECDVLCICGDIFPLQEQRDYYGSLSWYLGIFYPWVQSLKCKKVIMIAGNHDFFLEHLYEKFVSKPDDISSKIYSYRIEWTLEIPQVKELLEPKKDSKLIYLIDRGVEVEGIKFYGTPYIQDLSRWAFYLDNESLKDKFNEIPSNTDVLLTHQPPTLNNCGLVKQSHTFNYLNDYGSQILTDVITEKKNIKWVLSGHVHSGEHIPKEINNTNVVNVSIKDEDYKVKYNIFEFEL